MSAAGGFVAAETLLERFARDQAYGGEVDPKDPAIRAGSYRVSRQIRQTDGLFGLAVVAGQISRRDRYSCHANQGLNDYTRDVARRLAKQGYGALAIDFSRAMAVLRRPTLKAKSSAIFASSRFAGSFSRNIYNSNFDVHLI